MLQTIMGREWPAGLERFTQTMPEMFVWFFWLFLLPVEQLYYYNPGCLLDVLCHSYTSEILGIMKELSPGILSLSCIVIVDLCPKEGQESTLQCVCFSVFTGQEWNTVLLHSMSWAVDVLTATEEKSLGYHCNIWNHSMVCWEPVATRWHKSIEQRIMLQVSHTSLDGYMGLPGLPWEDYAHYGVVVSRSR